MSETDARLESPTFFIGMPRSGTTVLFEAFTARRDVGWLSQHLERAPAMPMLAVLTRLADHSFAMRRAVDRSDERGRALGKLRVGPAEAYAFWARLLGERFVFDYMIGETAPRDVRTRTRAAIAQVLRFEGKSRFTAKFTGPGRIEFLSSVFPDARFVHVVRDGRAVVSSLLNVGFWRDRDRMQRPAWEGGLTVDDLADWTAAGLRPVALAAVQWRRVVSSIRAEAERFAPERYAEVRYESFTAHPGPLLQGTATFANLPPSDRPDRYLAARYQLRNMNAGWQNRLRDEDRATLERLLAPTLETLGYGTDSDADAPPPGLTLPFAPASDRARS